LFLKTVNLIGGEYIDKLITVLDLRFSLRIINVEL